MDKLDEKQPFAASMHHLDLVAVGEAAKAFDQSSETLGVYVRMQFAITAYLANSTAAVDGQGADDRVVLLADRENLSKRVSELRGCVDSLMAKLATLLDEDKFSDCEEIARSAGVYPPALRSRPPSKPVGEVGGLVNGLRKIVPLVKSLIDPKPITDAANALEALTRQGEPVEAERDEGDGTVCLTQRTAHDNEYWIASTGIDHVVIGKSPRDDALPPIRLMISEVYARCAALSVPADQEGVIRTFQERVAPWMQTCFGPEISADTIERNHRFLEEALELVQATGCTASEAHQLVDYTFGRPVGEPAQEVGGVMVTLAALCLAQGHSMHEAGETELARVWTKVEKIRAKQAAKPKHSPLPEAPAPENKP